MPTLHLSGQVDCQSAVCTIDGNSLLDAIAAQDWHEYRPVRVYHDGEFVAEGPLVHHGASMEFGPAEVCDVGDFDVLGMLEDVDGFTVDLTLTDEPEPEPA